MAKRKNYKIEYCPQTDIFIIDRETLELIYGGLKFDKPDPNLYLTRSALHATSRNLYEICKQINATKKGLVIETSEGTAEFDYFGGYIVGYMQSERHVSFGGC